MAKKIPTLVFQARCARGRGPCVVNFNYPVGTTGIPVRFLRYASFDPEGEPTFIHPRSGYEAQTYLGTIAVKEAGPYLIECIQHQSQMHFRKLRTAKTDNPCSADCTMAEGDKCACSCGGANHGMEA